MLVPQNSPVGFIAEEAIGYQLFDAVGQEKSILSRLEGRTVASATVFQACSQAMDPADKREMILILKLVIGEELR
ncbi:MAG TPA: hypothetical protein VK208_06525 [Pyrinomonadaceae bacterium]|jgi:hypothetical protein|nr:hypothetical protein [Pyrinomonadaceae bacterium]